MIKLIVGLGNPGQQYEQTRHNAGFVFLDRLVSANRCNWMASAQFQGDVANCSVAGNKLVLLKPMTFMNKSGLSVGKLLRYYKIRPEEMLVAHDELELLEGVVRLKRDGGHAGHNGLRDIIAHVDSRDFYRLRIGIGRPASGANVADYVLSKPSREGGALLDEVCQRMVDKIELLISGDIDVAANELSIVRG
jgi:PTH1 family peptidyl-tRNA hydrolase